MLWHRDLKNKDFFQLWICPKKSWSLSKGRDVTHPSPAPWAASKAGWSQWKGSPDPSAWDLKKSLLRAGHWGTGFAGKTPILLENAQFYSSSITQWSSHSPSVGGHPKNCSGKSPYQAHPSSLFPQREAHPSPQILTFRLRHPKSSALEGSCWSGNNPWSHLKHPLPKCSSWKSPDLFSGASHTPSLEARINITSLKTCLESIIVSRTKCALF